MRYMEIMELAGVKKFKDMTVTDIYDYINTTFGSHSIKLLGSGTHGSAIKIGNDVYKFWMIDSAYTDFVKYCQANSNNPFLPKFLSKIKKMPAFFIRHPDAPDFVNYIKIEELYPDDRIMQTRFNLKMKRTIYNELPYIDLIDIAQAQRACTDSTMKSFVAALNSNIETTEGYKLRNMTPEIITLVHTLFDIDALNHKSDLRGDNIMKRSNSQIVFVDPIFNQADASLNSDFLTFDTGRTDLIGKNPVTYKKYKELNNAI